MGHAVRLVAQQATLAAIDATSSSSRASINEMRFPEDLVNAKNVEALPLQTAGPVVTDSIWIPSLNDPHNIFGWPVARKSAPLLRARAHIDSFNSTTWAEYQDRLQEAVEWAGLASLGASTIRTYSKTDSTCVYSPPHHQRGQNRQAQLVWCQR